MEVISFNINHCNIRDFYNVTECCVCLWLIDQAQFLLPITVDHCIIRIHFIVPFNVGA
jgi:hypothetical protein